MPVLFGCWMYLFSYCLGVSGCVCFAWVGGNCVFMLSD